MGLIREPWAAAVEGKDRRSCSLVALFSNGGPGGAVHNAEVREIWS